MKKKLILAVLFMIIFKEPKNSPETANDVAEAEAKADDPAGMI